MARQRFFNMPADAREKLLALALHEFAERGFEEASLNEILGKAGISKGAYYYYFDDKEDLLATAVDGVLDGLLERLPLPDFEGLTRDDFWPAIERSLLRWLEMFDSLHTLFRVLHFVNDARRRSPRFAPVLAKAETIWRKLVEAGQRVGCVRTDVPTDLLVRLIAANDAVLDSAFLEMHARVTRTAFEKHMRLVVDTVRRILEVEGPDDWSRPVSRRRGKRHGRSV